MDTSTLRRGGGIAGVVFALLLAVPAGAQQHFPPDDDLELMLRYLVEDGETPGIVLGVLDPDGATRAVSWGSAGPGGRSVDPETVFEIGALTMTFTAALLAQMVAGGEVALDDPVAGYLPEGVAVPSPGGYVMTVGDLATHRSGLPTGLPGSDADLSLDDLSEAVSTAELERPGRRYAFSHLGYALLGHVLARSAGTPYDALLRERILEPLELTSTGYDPAGGVAERRATGHADGEVARGVVVSEAMRGATGLHSSGADLLRFLAANVGPPRTELERALRLAHEIRVERGRPEEEVGYGFSWRTYSVARQPPVVTHAGSTDGFSALMAFEPVKGIGTVLLANTRGFDDWIGRNLLFFEPPRSKAPVAVAPEVLRRYEGTYKANLGRYTAGHGGGHYFIRLEDEGYLTYQARGLVRTRLYAESDSSFYMLRGPYTLTFSRHGDDVRLVIHVDEREPEAGRAGGWTAWRVDDEPPPPAVVAGNVGVPERWGPGVWAVVLLLGLAAAAVILRPLWRQFIDGSKGIRESAA